MTTRIVITGIGWVTPLGWEIERVWRQLLDGVSAIKPIRHFDASTFPTTFAAQVPAEYDYRHFVTHHDVHEQIGTNTTFALGAASQAWQAANLDAHAAAGLDASPADQEIDTDRPLAQVQAQVRQLYEQLTEGCAGQ